MLTSGAEVGRTGNWIGTMVKSIRKQGMLMDFMIVGIIDRRS